jgi:hypothetical protein
MNPREAVAGETAHSRRVPILFAVTGIVGVGVLAGLVRAVLIAPLHVPLDPNEGWNAYHAAAAMAGNPYPPSSGFLINNYPPLSFYLVGLIGSWLGDNVVAGRYVSLGAFGSVCLLIFMALRRMNAGLGAALFAALLFAGTLLLTTDYVGMNDPQLLGHTFQLAGLLFVVRARRTSSQIFAAGVFFVLGGFMKHNLFALPLATLAWLSILDRKGAFRLGAALLSLSLIGFIGVRVMLHIDLLHQLNPARSLSMVHLKAGALQWLPTLFPPLCLLLWLPFRHARDEVVVFVCLYAAISVATGVPLLGGAGVDVNVMFDADIALSFSAGLAISRLLAGGRRAAAQTVAALCVIPFAAIALHTPDWREVSFWLQPMREETALAKVDIAFLQSRAGAAMCEDLTFCYWAGKKPTVDVFNLNQQFETGARSSGPFLHLIRSRFFRSVEFDETVTVLFPKAVETAFRQYYRFDHGNDEGRFFVPR